MVDDEMCLFLNAAQRQTSGLTACADPFTQVCNAAEHWPAVAKNRDTARQAAAKTERHDPHMPRKGCLRPWALFFFAHGPEVLAALAEPDAPHSRKAAAAAERHDLALMQKLLPEPASDEYL